eukprot:m51a1_g7030 putative protein serine threonine kinase (459) ;mRNA; r:70215-72126
MADADYADDFCIKAGGSGTVKVNLEQISSLGSRDRSERATSELVLDNRTRMVLLKLINSNTVGQMHGCVSTGKEANVYYAAEPHGNAGPGYAVKVFKTSILVFKDRDKYVSGEFRFRRGYAKHNPRKMVKLWAEKEMRNLLRLHTAGVPVPKPTVVRGNVLVMEFVGKDGWPAPRLKDAEMPLSKLTVAYAALVKNMRTMYHVCHLVHADLSEFNILYFQGELKIIDVSQAVEHDHPHSLEFLRMDVSNVTDFFSKRGVCTLSKMALFNLVTDPTLDDARIDEHIARGIEQSASCDAAARQVEEATFLRSFIPRTLSEVTDAERDIFEPHRAPQVFYDTVTGIKHDGGAEDELECEDDDDDDEDDDEESEEEDDEDEDEDGSEDDEDDEEEGEEKGEMSKEEAESKAVAEKQAVKAARKENKKKVREEKKEARALKMKKKEKQKLIKKSQHLHPHSKK